MTGNLLHRNEIILIVILSLASLANAAVPLSNPMLSNQSGFEFNAGQTNSDVRFLLRSPAYTLFASDHGVLLKGALPIQMTLLQASASMRVEAEDLLPGRVNYFLGNDPAQWRRNIPTFGKLRYKSAYTGIDLTFYRDRKEMEYDFVVAPHAEPGNIRIRLKTDDVTPPLRLDAAGDLLIGSAPNQVRFRKPLVYQLADADPNRRLPIDGRYQLQDDGSFKFSVGRYDRSKTLIIDPVIAYSTFLGGSDDEGIFGIKRDRFGNLFLAGETSSLDFPTNRPAQSKLGGDYDGFVTKFDRSGTQVIYSTYLGGNMYDHCTGLAIDGNGDAYVSGLTYSPNFPTANAIQATLKGRANAFVSHLDESGSQLVFSTYLGGSGFDSAEGVALGPDGSVYVAGGTQSVDFPISGNAFQSRCDTGGISSFCSQDAFVTRMDALGSRLIYSTYLGGKSSDSASSIAVDQRGAAYVGGGTSSSNFPTQNAYQSVLAGPSDAFLTRLSPEGDTVEFSTYFGGSKFEGVRDIALDAAGNLYLAGTTSSTDLPIRNALQPANAGGSLDGFFAKFDGAGDKLVYSSYLGGAGQDIPFRIAVDFFQSLSIVGSSTSTDFPVMNAVQPQFGGGMWDAFVTKISPSGEKLIYSTYLGGAGDEFGYAIYSDLKGNIWVGGSASSPDYPTLGAFQPTYGGGPYDAFLTELKLDFVSK